MKTDNYVADSLELHLFFGRIMKEHSLFLKAGFTTVEANYIAKAEFFKNEFEKLLDCAISLTNGCVTENILCSGEIVTEFTDAAERQTEKLTGISINHNITKKTLRLTCGNCCKTDDSFCQVKSLNQTALNLLNGLISFKEEILHKVLCCQMYTVNYPLLLEHIIREAKLYRKYVQMLENDGAISIHSMKEVECFWNQIMMEHALFIRGLLDPTEEELIQSANEFAGNYAELLNNCRNVYDRIISNDALAVTGRFREFKATGVRGITNCQIRSLILPLLADHVLREANHYIRLLKSC